MNFIIDIILIVVFVTCIIVSAKKGLIVAVADIVAVVAGVAGGRYLSNRFAPIIYDKFFCSTVREHIEKLFTDGVLSPDNIKDKFMSAFAFLPENIYNTIQSSSLFSADKFDLTKVTDATSLESKIVAPVMTSICRGIIYAIITVVIIFAVRFVAKFICKHLLPKLLKKANTTAGGILGAVKGFLIVVISANVLDIVSLTNKTLNNYVVQSYVCSFVRDNLNILSFFGK